MFNFTCHQQHLSDATKISLLGYKMTKKPLSSNTFLGGACVASANEQPITDVSVFWLVQTSGPVMTYQVWASANEHTMLMLKDLRPCFSFSQGC